MAKVKCKQHNSGIGGQAVLEGVMMRRGDDYAVAIRKPDKTVTVSKETYHGILEGSILKKTPFVRGVFVFLDSLILGMRITSYSASFYEEEEEDTKKDQTPEQAARSEKMDKIMEGAVTAVAFVIAIGLFFVLPYLISALLSRFIHHPFLTAVIEGLLRIGIFLGYILAISMMEDIRRLFQYHGAEHKCINCLEHGLPLNVENVRGSTRFHKRCGTSFIIFVMLVSIVLFFFIRVDHPMLRILLRIGIHHVLHASRSCAQHSVDKTFQVIKAAFVCDFDGFVDYGGIRYAVHIFQLVNGYPKQVADQRLHVVDRNL